MQRYELNIVERLFQPTDINLAVSRSLLLDLLRAAQVGLEAEVADAPNATEQENAQSQLRLCRRLLALVLPPYVPLEIRLQVECEGYHNEDDYREENE